MAAVAETGNRASAALRVEWLPVLAGLLVLYVPTFYDFATTLWQMDEHAHGPIIVAIVVWLFWNGRATLLTAPVNAAPAAGVALLVFGLLAYVLGRSQAITIFEAGALAPILAGVLLATRGGPAVRRFWFPIFFVAFMVPLPGIFVDALTGPLKQSVSEITVLILRFAGFPIAREGVVIVIGQYQLLVADACSGMNSMFSLSALGLLFMYLMRRASLLHNVVVLLSILPIAFAANIVRVLFLILITYHFGDAAGQGFLHGSAGMVLLLAALAILLILDSILARALRPRTPA
jgi:exosortase B